MQSITFTFAIASDPLGPFRFWMILFALAIFHDEERRKRKKRERTVIVVVPPPRP